MEYSAYVEGTDRRYQVLTSRIRKARSFVNIILLQMSRLLIPLRKTLTATSHSTTSSARESNQIRQTASPVQVSSSISHRLMKSRGCGHPNRQVSLVRVATMTSNSRPNNATFDWRGHKLLKVASSHWEVLGYGEDPDRSLQWVVTCRFRRLCASHHLSLLKDNVYSRWYRHLPSNHTWQVWNWLWIPSCCFGNNRHQALVESVGRDPLHGSRRFRDPRLHVDYTYS